MDRVVGHVVKLVSGAAQDAFGIAGFEVQLAVAGLQRENSAIVVETNAAKHLAMGEGAEVGEEIAGEGDISVADAHDAFRFSSNLMLSPQPQASTTLGLRNLKPLSSRDTS